MAHIQTQRPFSIIPRRRSREDELLAAMRLREFNAVPNTSEGADQRRILSDLITLEKTASTPQQVARGPQAVTEFMGRQNANVSAISLRRRLAGDAPLRQRTIRSIPRPIGDVAPVEQGGQALAGTGGGRDIAGRAQLIELRQAGAEADRAGSEARTAALAARSPLERAQDQASVAGVNARPGGIQRIDNGEEPSFTDAVSSPEGGAQINAARFQDPDFADTQAALQADRDVGGQTSPGERIAGIQAGVSRERFALQERMQQFASERAIEARELVEQGLDVRQANQIATQNFQIKMTGLSALAKQTQDAFQDTSLFRGINPESQEARDRLESGLEAGPDAPGLAAGADPADRQRAIAFWAAQNPPISDPTDEEIQQFLNSGR